HANFGKFLFSMKVSGLAEINDIQSSLSAGYTDSHVETFTPHEAMNVRVNITEGERMYGRFFIPFP
ncbi:MAG: hypothetical protein JW709_13045, partial [Sedimentisphaerales bacterium]|nr:hypothetical protein [Sedimentisphaerales bacterium]